MTLANGIGQLESARLILRRIAPDDLPFFARLHAQPEVAQALYPEGRPRTVEETAIRLQRTLVSYEEFSLGHLAVLRKADGALIERCGLTELVAETETPEHGLRKGWFGRERVPAGLAPTFECELGYTFDPNALGPGLRDRSGTLRSRLRSRRAAVVLRGLCHSSAQHPLASRRRGFRRASCRANGCNTR